jgi:glycosyltransferase involved in cell wall biosynthesis
VENDRQIKPLASSVIWNGIASDAVAPFPRAELRLAAEDLVLINVGTLEQRKNQLGLIDLFADIARSRPEARLVLVGDGPHRADIQRRIVDYGVTDKVRMLGMRHDVPALLAMSDLYLHYAAMENCPVVLLEAARAGLPIAAVAGGGVPELLTALQGVALDPIDRPASLAALQPLLADRAHRQQAGHIAQQAFTRLFTREAMTAAYLNALNMAPVPQPEPLP